jgi:hypothetical protein
MLKVVYAKSSTVIASPGGMTVMVPWGSHWPADDPIVVAHPEIFTEDPGPGLRISAPRTEDGEFLETATATPGSKRVRRV